MTKKNRFVTIMAFFALFGIIIGIVGTGILIIFTSSNTSEEQTLTPEQYLELQELMNSQSGVILENNSGSLEVKSLTGSTGTGTLEIK
ncbi:MAG: hypothetical protein QM490_02125 [Candidatus Gracilibacteria bacterium]